MTNKEHKIDATNAKLGRVATEVAHVLMGKDDTDFAKNKVIDTVVTVDNANAMDISDKKLNQKQYQRYSGYPGGRKVKLMKQVVEHKGMTEILRKAVNNMLPNNKLRKPRMKNLIVNE